jgi:hypothetical protein
MQTQWTRQGSSARLTACPGVIPPCSTPSSPGSGGRRRGTRLRWKAGECDEVHWGSKAEGHRAALRNVAPARMPQVFPRKNGGGNWMLTRRSRGPFRAGIGSTDTWPRAVLRAAGAVLRVPWAFVRSSLRACKKHRARRASKGNGRFASKFLPLARDSGLWSPRPGENGEGVRISAIMAS